MRRLGALLSPGLLLGLLLSPHEAFRALRPFDGCGRPPLPCASTTDADAPKVFEDGGFRNRLFAWPGRSEAELEGMIPLQRVQDATVRIFCRHSFPDVLQPWQRERQIPSTSSGFCIKGRRIITNAHAIEHGTLVQVRRRERGKKFVAQVVAEAPECDLAVLTVLEDEFWKGMPSVEFGQMPALDDDVKVIGYPVGGDTMSITAGVVSRVEMQTYAQAAADLLAIQIDAAINPGNSGGPVVDDANRVVGIAFQSLVDADVENCGYVIPAEILGHLLEDIERHGRYTGFPSIGVNFQGLESPWLRRHAGLKPSAEDEEELGILVTQALPSVKQVQVGDVLLAVDGLPVSSDGTIPFSNRPGERVSVRHHFCQKFKGDSVVLDLRRDGQTHQIPVELSVLKPLVPYHFAGDASPYLIVGGLVFSPLSVPYLQDLEDDGVGEDAADGIHGRGSGHYGYMLEKATFDTVQEDYEEVVVMTQVLAHESNVGYLGLEAVVLETLNGVKVRSLQHLAQLLGAMNALDLGAEGKAGGTAARKGGDAPTDLVFEFYRGGLVVLDRELAQRATREVCEEQGIGEAMTPSLRSSLLAAVEQADGVEQVQA